MTTTKYTVTTRDCSGYEHNQIIYARSIRGAKTQAAKIAFGSVCYVKIDGPDFVAQCFPKGKEFRTSRHTWEICMKATNALVLQGGYRYPSIR